MHEPFRYAWVVAFNQGLRVSRLSVISLAHVKVRAPPVRILFEPLCARSKACVSWLMLSPQVGHLP